MRLGVCYYPEQGRAEDWSADAKLMSASGIELVRIGDTAWAAYEPARNQFRWDWLDRAVDTLAGAGLSVVLATPTAAPPIWLARERPDIVAIGPDLRPQPYGAGRFTCPTSSAYRYESRRIVSALVERYGRHDAVVAWQIDNEPGGHDSARCWCSACESAFSSWLHDRYGTIDALNDAWHSVVGSQVYPDFESVLLPRPSPDAQSPSLVLAHRRFASDTVLEGVSEQFELVQRGSPGRDVTVNHRVGDLHVDQAATARLTGVAARASDPQATASALDVAFEHDLARGQAGPDGRAWIMEQQAGPIGATFNLSVTPGQVRLWGWQGALHGVDAMLFHPWRPSPGGPEQYRSGLLRHDGTADRGLDEVRRLAAELSAARTRRPELLERPSAAAAVLYDVEDAWAIDIGPQRQGLSHRVLVRNAYEALLRLGLAVDVVGPTDDLTRYQVLVAPACHIADAARIESLVRAVDAGRLVVLGPRSLAKTIDNCWVGEAQPAELSARLGARVAEGVSQTAAVKVLVGRGETPSAPSGPWTDVLELLPDAPHDARVIATYEGSYLDGMAAAVRRGNLVYVGFSSVDAWTALLGSQLGLEPEAEPSTERFRRGGRTVVLDQRNGTTRGLPGD